MEDLLFPVALKHGFEITLWPNKVACILLWVQAWAEHCCSAPGGSAWLVGLLVSLGIAESLVSRKDLMLAQHLPPQILGLVSWDDVQASLFPCVFDPAATGHLALKGKGEVSLAGSVPGLKFCC